MKRIKEFVGLSIAFPGILVEEAMRYARTGLALTALGTGFIGVWIVPAVIASAVDGLGSNPDAYRPLSSAMAVVLGIVGSLCLMTCAVSAVAWHRKGLKNLRAMVVDYDGGVHQLDDKAALQQEHARMHRTYEEWR